MEYEENLLETESFTEDDISSDENDSLEEQLDRIEALLNEEITLRETEQSQTEMVTESGSEYTESTTSSGVDAPNYPQYIYDYLTDSTIKVEIVGEKNLFEKQLNEYTVGESLEVVGIVLGFIALSVAFINKYTFKRSNLEKFN